MHAEIKVYGMEYRGIRYTVRARVQRGTWTITIYPTDEETIEKGFTGQRRAAEARAHTLIDQWLRPKEQSKE